MCSALYNFLWHSNGCVYSVQLCVMGVHAERNGIMEKRQAEGTGCHQPTHKVMTGMYPAACTLRGGHKTCLIWITGLDLTWAPREINNCICCFPSNPSYAHFEFPLKTFWCKSWTSSLRVWCNIINKGFNGTVVGKSFCTCPLDLIFLIPADLWSRLLSKCGGAIWPHRVDQLFIWIEMFMKHKRKKKQYHYWLCHTTNICVCYFQFCANEPLWMLLWNTTSPPIYIPHFILLRETNSMAAAAAADGNQTRCVDGRS